MNTACPKEFDHVQKQKSCFHTAKSGFYVQELYRIGLWPISDTKIQMAMSIQTISNRLRGLRDYYMTDAWTMGRQCDLAKINFKQRLEDAMERTTPDSGLCLNCVKKGKIMSADGNCRAASLELCTNLFQLGLDRT